MLLKIAMRAEVLNLISTSTEKKAKCRVWLPTHKEESTHNRDTVTETKLHYLPFRQADFTPNQMPEDPITLQVRHTDTSTPITPLVKQASKVSLFLSLLEC